MVGGVTAAVLLTGIASCDDHEAQQGAPKHTVSATHIGGIACTRTTVEATGPHTYNVGVTVDVTNGYDLNKLGFTLGDPSHGALFLDSKEHIDTHGKSPFDVQAKIVDMHGIVATCDPVEIK